MELLVFVPEVCVLPESGVDGSSRSKYSGVIFRGIVIGLLGSRGGFIGEDDILVSIRGDAFVPLELLLVSRWEMLVLTMMFAALVLSLCGRGDAVAMEVCLVPSSNSGAGDGD